MLELVELSKSFGATQAAKAISLRLPRNQTLALLGPSGCGKSTLLKMVAGLITPDHGQICFKQQEVTHIPPEKRQFALMFQDFALFPHMNVLENVCFGLRAQGLSATLSRQKAHAMLQQLDLASYASRSVQRLSGGEQQRVALARALATQPRLLLLDEPFSNLDAYLRLHLQDTFKTLFQERQLTVIWVTHDRAEAFAMADHIAVLDAGALIQYGTPQSLLTQPTNGWLASFIGYENVFEHHVIPEAAISLSPAQKGETASIQHVRLLGEHVQLTVKLGDTHLKTTLSAREAAQWKSGLVAGQPISITLDSKKFLPLL